MFYLKGSKRANRKQKPHTMIRTLFLIKRFVNNNPPITLSYVHNTVNNFYTLTIVSKGKTFCENYEF